MGAKWRLWVLKFMFSKKATKIDEIFTADLTLCSKCQIDGEDFVIFVAFLENTNVINPKEKVLRVEIWHPFLEIWAEVKNFLRLSRL